MVFDFRRLGAAPAAISLVVLMTSGPAATAAADPATVYHLVFEAPHFANVENGSTVSYHFVRNARDPKLQPSFEDEVKLLVGPKGAENSINIDLFSGARAETLSNMSRTGNPVIVAMLEQDVKDMNKTLGGSPFYFRNRLRQALSEEKPAEPAKFKVDGKTVEGWKVAFKPFANDKDNLARLREYAGRSYEILFTDAVPGGVYAIKTVTPRANGEALLTEELTLNSEASK